MWLIVKFLTTDRIFYSIVFGGPEMNLTVGDYLTQITEKQVVKTEETTTAAKVQQATTLKKAIEAVLDALDTGHLGQYCFDVKMPKGEPVSFRIETNLINVPMGESERLDQRLLDKELSYPVNMYMVLEGDAVNKSDLRIDDLANETDQAGNVADLVKKAQEWLAEHLATVTENRQEDAK